MYYLTNTCMSLIEMFSIASHTAPLFFRINSYLPERRTLQSLACKSRVSSVSPSSENLVVGFAVPICFVCDPNATSLSSGV